MEMAVEEAVTTEKVSAGPSAASVTFLVKGGEGEGRERGSAWPCLLQLEGPGAL